MRTVGFGWVEFAPKWSSGSDEEIGSVADLTGQLKEIIEEEVRTVALSVQSHGY